MKCNYLTGIENSYLFGEEIDQQTSLLLQGLDIIFVSVFQRTSINVNLMYRSKPLFCLFLSS